MIDWNKSYLKFALMILNIGPIEVDLAVEANNVAGEIACHGNSSVIDSLSCEVRRKNGKVDQPRTPCMLIMPFSNNQLCWFSKGACNSSFTFHGLAAGKHRVLVVTGAGGSRTETSFCTCRKSIIHL